MHSVGVARDVSGGSIQYIEHHQYLQTGEHLVKYFDPAGMKLVAKKMTYPLLPQHPQIQQVDFARERELRVVPDIGTVRMVTKQDGRTKEYQLPLDEATIIDAGFDFFIRDHWDLFRLGERQVYKFAIAGHANLLDVSITKVRESSDGTTFSLKPSNFFVRLLVPTIRVDYDGQKRLKAYHGTTNLDVKARDVVIEFSHYNTTEQLARPMAGWFPHEQ
ncbi:MAG: hypothetical protein P8L31_01805 [Pseudomonadales bacterium]|nr:hypothetical protein [Pseudomonadales bacterium]